MGVCVTMIGAVRSPGFGLPSGARREAPTAEQRRRLVALLDGLAPRPGRSQTAWPGLRVFRALGPTSPDPGVYVPALCIVAQGAKEAELGGRRFRYDPLHYLVIGAPLPVHARVIEASPEEPFLSLVLDVGSREVHDLLTAMEGQLQAERAARPVVVDAVTALPRAGGAGAASEWASEWNGGPPLRVSPLDARLLDAVLRLLAAVADPVERRVLVPGCLREILFLALQREQGDLLRLATRRDPHATGVARALRYLHGHLAHPLAVAAVAREAGMSSSLLHQAFKRATTLSPMQYLKRLRLDHARQLLLDEGCQAAEAAHRVGYESPSQFSREFKRLYGLPPRAYRELLLASGEDAVG